MMQAPEQPSSRWRGLLVVFAVIALAATATLLVRSLSPSISSLTSDARAAIFTREAPKALETTKRLVAVAPQSTESWVLRAKAGMLARQRDIWEPAIAQVEKLSRSEAAPLWTAAGAQEMRRLQAASAEFALRRSLALSPDQAEPWRLLEQLISVQGRPRETTECLLALIRLQDFSTTDLDTLAWPNAAINDPERVRALLAADPSNMIPALGQVGTALNENRTQNARDLLWTITDRHPDCSRAIALLGLVLAELDDQKFLYWQRELSSRADVEPEIWIARGVWLVDQGQMPAAARCFHRAVELDPRHVRAVSELGQSLRSLGESELAAKFLDWARLQQEITELDRRIQEKAEQENMRRIVQALEQAGRLWEAWAWSRAILHAFPDDEVASAALARLTPRLKPELPRTIPEAVPGKEYNWSRFPDPDWSHRSTNRRSDPQIRDPSLVFIDRAAQLGIDFHFENGPDKGNAIVQTSGGGVAAFDFDRDGWCDVYFTQGGTDPSAATQTVFDALYRNIGGESFVDITLPSGIREDRFSQGVAAGDIDNDGFPDLYVANVGRNRLLRNNGDGTFTDITDSSGLTSSGWTTSVAIADLTGDGNPDLFSVRYAGGPEIYSRTCGDSSGRPGVCRPTLFPAEADLLAVSSGDGHYSELCAEAGLDLPDGRGFGSIIADFNGDRRLDIFVANDQTANFLLIQADADPGAVRFVDEAIVRGVAFDRDGLPQACMGIASGDINRDGRLDLFVTNFADESNTLYISQPDGAYLDLTRAAGLRDASFKQLGFGTQFLDADLDGILDLVVLNGHIQDSPEQGKPAAMLPQLFRGMGGISFSEVVYEDPERFFNKPRIGRGLCLLDWNADGRQDLAASFLDGTAALVANESPGAGHWIAIEFVGVQSSRDAIGTTVRLEFSDGTDLSWQATAGDGFAASNQRRLHQGLGSRSQISRIEIEWPSGVVQEFKNVASDTVWTAIEGRSKLWRSRLSP